MFLKFLIYPLCFLAGAVVEKDKINVHIVAHTHDDVGWLKTADQYYVGLNNTIQDVAVRNIIHNVVMALGDDPERTFIYVEQAFFQRWWREQNDKMKKLVRRLVRDKQLVFINGGWCMHDEGATHYIDMIDQTALGHRFLKDQFNVTPTIGWQIDPFGHSLTQATHMSAEMGFEGLFFGRIDFQELKYRQEEKKCEFIWKDEQIGTSVFTGLTGQYQGNYGAPEGFNFQWGVDGIQDNKDLEDYNVDSRIDEFVKAAEDLAKMTRGNNIMFTMGSDFNFEPAYRWYLNLDKLIKYANADGRVNAFYSTPEKYVAMKKAERREWPEFEGDFFPYADGPHQFWTGYFTSRPGFKRFARANSELLQTVRQLAALHKYPRPPSLLGFEEAMGIAQHHDAVSGTEKQHVTFDYTKQVHRAAQAALLDVNPAVFDATEIIGYCPLRNESRCEFVKDEAVFTVWNPLGQARRELMEFPIPIIDGRHHAGLNVIRRVGEAVEAQIVPAFSSGNYGPVGAVDDHLLFFADVPHLGFETYKFDTKGSRGLLTHTSIESDARDGVMENDFLRVTFSKGLLQSVFHKKDQALYQVNQRYLYYASSTGDAINEQPSGAYIFRPKTGEKVHEINDLDTFKIYKGKLVSEVHQSWGTGGETIRQRIRLVEERLDVTMIVGPLPMDTEIVTRYHISNFRSDGFFTDSNGRQMLHRRLDKRPDSPLFNQTEPVAGNYYPVDGAIYIKDEDSPRQFSILTNTAQGGTSLRPGEIEIMVHRRCSRDDSRGVGEPLDEREHVNSYAEEEHFKGNHTGRPLIAMMTHWLIFSPHGEAQFRKHQDRLFGTLQPFFVKKEALNSRTYIQPLPENVQLLTLDRFDSWEGKPEHHLIVRLAHQYGDPVSVNLQHVFEPRITGILELSLSANQERNTMPQWGNLSRRKLDGFVATLENQQIRTFKLTIGEIAESNTYKKTLIYE